MTTVSSLVVQRRLATLRQDEGPGVFELVQDFRGGAYRVAYTVRFERAIYLLHCYQKKSPSGIRTGRTFVKLIRERLRVAQADYRTRYGQKT